MRGCVLKQRHVAKDCEGCRTNRKEKEKEKQENYEEERERSERLSANRARPSSHRGANEVNRPHDRLFHHEHVPYQ